MKFPQGSKHRHGGDGRGLRPNRHIKHERFPSITFSPETSGADFFSQAAAAKISFLLVFGQGKGRGI
jgi:hypothetical protein